MICSTCGKKELPCDEGTVHWKCPRCTINPCFRGVPPEPPERNDYIAQAYRGELTVAAALKLAASLVLGAEEAVRNGYGGYVRRHVPADEPLSMEQLTVRIAL